MYYMPQEQDIARVMQEMRMDRLQAIRHLQTMHALSRLRSMR